MRNLTFICGLVMVLTLVRPARSAEVDLSTPIAAAATVLSALNEGDAATAKAGVIEGDQIEETVDAMAGLSRELRRLGEAVKKRFNEEGEKITGPLSRTKEILAQLQKTKPKVDGDEATITLDGERPMKLKRVDGKWKVDLAAMAPGKLDEAILIMKATTDAARTTADEIEAGKFGTMDEAQAAFYGRVVRAMEDLPLVEPTTAPAAE